MRARLFAERGWVRWLDPDLLAAETLADAILRTFASTAPPVQCPRPDLTGRHVAVRRLLSLVADSGRAPLAASGQM